MESKETHTTENIRRKFMFKLVICAAGCGAGLMVFFREVRPLYGILFNGVMAVYAIQAFYRFPQMKGFRFFLAVPVAAALAGIARSVMLFLGHS